MAIYGIDTYGTTTYGYTAPPSFRVDPFVAVATDYDRITISWNQPTGTVTAWRLVKNMTGPPTDQDDGQLLIDTTAGYPGSLFVDTSVIPGKYHYYGFFLLTSGGWIKSAVTACLAVLDLESNEWIKSLIPGYFINSTGALQPSGVALDQENVADTDDTVTTFLDRFIIVLGWGLDYLRTQYATYTEVNNPWIIPPADLFNLAEQLGINVNPDIHTYTLRKAVYNNATVNRQRGTKQGIDAELTALTGYGIDLQVGQNFMLENDQSYFLDPVFPAWSQYIAYNIGETVQYGLYWYQCIATGNIGNPPTGTTASNTWWSAILSVNNSTYLANSKTGGINTWELIYPASSNGQPPASTLFETLGIADPLVITGVTPLNGNPFFQSGSTGSSTGWVAHNAASVSFSQAVSYIYPYSGVLTSNGTSGGAAEESGAPVAVTPLTTYTSGVWLYSPVSTTVSVGMDWNTSSHTFISTSWIQNVALAANQWKFIFFSGSSPSNAAFAYPRWGWAGASTTGQVLYGQGAVFFAGSFAGQDFTNSSLQGINLSGSTITMWLRSVARTTTDLATVTTDFHPDKDQAVGDGIPVPFALSTQTWVSTKRYNTDDIVLYNSVPYIALRASTGITPPYTVPPTASNEWAPVGMDQRLRICVSSFLTGSAAVAATPFVEWYDANGNYITRVFARDSLLPISFAYDSFTTGANSYISGRTTDDGSTQWTNTVGSFQVSPYNSGCAFPSVTGQRTLALLQPPSSNANVQVGVTFVTNPQAGQSEGLVLRYQNDSNYLRASQTDLRSKIAGAWTTLGTYSTAFSAGDRMVVQLNGTSITVLRNGVSVLSVTNSFNTTGTIHGMIVETT